jgi:hypothetical protein
MTGFQITSKTTVAQLKAEAKARGLKGYSKLLKAGLIALLSDKVEAPKAAQAAPKAAQAAPKAAVKPIANIYAKAEAFLELADARAARARVILEPSKKGLFWTEKKIAQWNSDGAIAVAKANAAVAKAASTIAKIQRLVDAAQNNRDYAKAVAARVAMRDAIWAEAYGRAMPKEWINK